METPRRSKDGSVIRKCIAMLMGVFVGRLQISGIDFEFSRWLRQTEQKAILPFKWSLLVAAGCFWVISRRDNLGLSVSGVILLFTVYFLATLLESYCFRFGKISLNHIRAVSIASYGSDYIFIVLINVLSYVYAKDAVPGASYVFLLLFFLLILRGMTVFRTERGALFANLFGGVFASVVVILFGVESTAGPNVVDFAAILFIILILIGTWTISGVILAQKAELMRIRERIVRSENLAMVGQMTSGLAHEINNPVGIISAYAEFLSRNATPDDPNLKDYEAIFSEAKRCKRLLEELLQHARSKPYEFREVALRDVLTDVIKSVQGSLTQSESVAVNLNMPEDVTLTADSSRLHQLFLNIVLNALHASSSQTETPVLIISVSCDKTSNSVTVIVSDSGPGFESGVESKVFEPFYSTKSKGTGLGLWISHEIVKAHGGTIIAQNRSARPGGEIVIELPLDLSETN